MTKAANPFALMVKAAGSNCNLRCRYCYYLGNDVSHHQLMTEECLRTLIRKYIEASPQPVLSFVWHGGEPMLRGLEFYRKAVAIQKELLPEGWQCWNNLQTNGTLLNDEWGQFLKDEHFDVGISIDGTDFIHDEYRLDANGEGTYDLVADKIRLLMKYGIKPDLLCTVTQMTSEYGYEVYNNLKRFNTGWIQFIPIVNRDENGNITEESVRPESYGDFLCTAFNQWLYNDLGRNNVQLFAEMLNVYAGGRQNLCWLSPRCGNVPVVESDGKVYSCDHFVNHQHYLGNIIEDDFPEMLDSEEQRTFGNKKADLSDKCKKCRYKNLCNGGCPKDRQENGDNYLCEGLYQLFSLADEPLRKTVSMLKQGYKPDQIMPELRKDRREKWKAVGKNSPCPCGSGRKFKNCCGK